MISGLKRSMPCEDLLSLSRALLDADKFLDDSISSLISTTVMSKRRRIIKEEHLLNSNEGLDNQHSESAPSSSSSMASLEDSTPATAALEAALTFDQDGYDADLIFEQPVKITLMGTNDFLFPGESCTNTHCTNNTNQQTVNDMTRAFAYISTAPKA